MDWLNHHKDDPPLPPKEEEPHPNPKPEGWGPDDPPMPGVDEPHVPMEDNWVNRMLVKNTQWDTDFCDVSWGCFWCSFKESGVLVGYFLQTKLQ